MQPSLRAIQFPSIGETTTRTEHRFAWVPVEFYFDQDDLGTHAHIEIKVAITYEENWTVEQIKQAAFEKARALLQQANEVAGRGYAELMQATRDRDAEDRRQHEAMTKQLLGNS